MHTEVHEPAAGLQHAGCLPQRRTEVIEVRMSEERDDGIKLRVAKGQIVAVSAHKLSVACVLFRNFQLVR